MLTILNPSTGNPIETIEEDNEKSIEAKVKNARSIFPDWSGTLLETRRDAIRRFRDLLKEKKEHLASLLTLEMGKPISQSRNELESVRSRIDFFLEKCEGVLTTEIVGESEVSEWIEKLPLGTIANISAWNYPYFIGINIFVPALLTGNTVLYKPSEYATLTGLEMTRLLHTSGVPEAAFSVIVGGGESGSRLLKQPLDGVYFTGSNDTGRKISAALGGRLVRLQLELGGKDPVYVCDDVNVKTAAASLADGAMYNTGQSCCSVERIYIHDRIFDHFVEEFLSVVKKFIMGDPGDERTYIGPLVREPQIKFLENQVLDARSKGARILCGGNRVQCEGFFFAPAVLTNVNHQMELMREESFGPVIGLCRVKSDEEAIALMNDTRYGLTAGVYACDADRAKKILSQISSGSVYWNCCDRVSPRLPWSGWGESGLGCTLSHYGILSFVKFKAWHLKNAL